MYGLITEVQASQGTTESRKNKIIYLLVSWRRYLPPYRDCTIARVFKAISTIKTATGQCGRSFKQNTIHGHIILTSIVESFRMRRSHPGAGRPPDSRPPACRCRSSTQISPPYRSTSIRQMKSPSPSTISRMSPVRSPANARAAVKRIRRTVEWHPEGKG